jgi:hypothetical protein
VLPVSRDLDSRPVRSAIPALDDAAAWLAVKHLASIEGLAVNSVYMADLDEEIEATARAYAGRRHRHRQPGRNVGLTISEYRCCRPRLLPWRRRILQRPGR